MAKEKSHRRHFRVGKWVNIAGKILGVTIIASPAISATVTQLKGGTPQAIPGAILLNYSGYDINNPNASFNWQQLGVGIAAVGGGIAIIKLFQWISKRV